jgi:methylated-DNA-[protein]-cysteine S-methyltransferase
MVQETFYYDSVATAFGPVAIVWRKTPAGPRVRQVFLTRGGLRAAGAVRAVYPEARQLSSRPIAGLGKRIARFLSGAAITFDLGMVDLEACGEFQRRVLLAEHGIPRGRVSTYGRIARHLGLGRASRAVGTALARNPFPIIIPCHRAVRSDGSLGGYQGGPAMKRALLAMEGVEFTVRDRVVLRRVHY